MDFRNKSFDSSHSFESDICRKYKYFLDSGRVIAHIDVDCFSVQVSRRYVPGLIGKPVVTTNTSKGLIDCVSYEAREKGVCKGMTVKQAKDKCPDIIVVTKAKVGSERDRKVSAEMFEVIKKISKDMIIEKTSKDDFFIDLTEKCEKFIADGFKYDQNFLDNIDVTVEGGNKQFKLAQNKSLQRSKWAEAAVIVCDICDEIYSKTGLICSAGISFNKLLAKIGCKINKPHELTIIASKPAIDRIFKTYPIWMVSGLGGKFGEQVEKELKVSKLRDLREFRRRKLIGLYGKEGSFLWEVCRGIDWEPVKFTPEFKLLCQQKMFNTAIDCRDPLLEKFLKSICELFVKRLIKDMEQNKRIAHKIRIEVFSKFGRTFSTTSFLFSKKYDSKQIYTTIKTKGFPKIADNVPQHIIGFRIIALDFGSVKNFDFGSISNITEQLNELTI